MGLTTFLLHSKTFLFRVLFSCMWTIPMSCSSWHRQMARRENYISISIYYRWGVHAIPDIFYFLNWTFSHFPNRWKKSCCSRQAIEWVYVVIVTLFIWFFLPLFAWIVQPNISSTWQQSIMKIGINCYASDGVYSVIFICMPFSLHYNMKLNEWKNLSIHMHTCVWLKANYQRFRCNCRLV